MTSMLAKGLFSVAVLAAWSLLPVAAAAAPPAEALLGSCSVIIVGTSAAICMFICVPDHKVHVSFTGIGSVQGVCPGAAAACATIGTCSANSLTTVARSAASFTGICTISGTGSGSCSS